MAYIEANPDKRDSGRQGAGPRCETGQQRGLGQPGEEVEAHRDPVVRAPCPRSRPTAAKPRAKAVAPRRPKGMIQTHAKIVGLLSCYLKPVGH
jgi:hypothetical protein